MLNPLPLGRSTFAPLRERHEIYVDKTDLILSLAQNDAKIFLARPRRFGKTLLVSTFESLFRDGLKHFRGLAIEGLWKDKTYPVIRLDFSGLTYFESRAQFEAALQSLLQSCFLPLGFGYRPELSSVCFMDQLKMWLARQPGSSLVLLIDAYDTPLTSQLDDRAAFETIRGCLAEFFAALKQYEGCFRFFFMTGIIKFTSTSIFSEFNIFQDISLDPLYGTLLGYTAEEIEDFFGDYLDRAALVMKLDRKEVLERLREYYDGFTFDEEAGSRVFCPWSVLNFLNRPKRGFLNYWYSSGGQPTVLMKYLANHALSQPISYGQRFEVRLSQVGAARQFDDAGLEALLTQAGYYTIREITADHHAVLEYPNREVAESMAQLYADQLLQGRRVRSSTPIGQALDEGDVEAVVDYFNAAVSAIDYLRYPITDEASCRTYVQVLLIGAAMAPRVEVHSALGRSDMEVEAGDLHWVFEFKFARESSQAQRLLLEAVAQMRSRRYGSPSHASKRIGVALVFDKEQRRFVLYKCL